MLIPVILSGGLGSRLWPVSREACPKPFIRLPDGLSLLQKTYLRAAGLEGVAEVVTVTNREYYFLTKDEYQRTGVKVKDTFLLEPMGRGTAAAIALAAIQVAATHGDEAQLLVLSADHLITHLQAFADAVKAASELADQGLLVTFGIQPTAPETGFGYVEAGQACGAGNLVLRFVEKPDAKTAEEYIKAGNFYWNSGMFCLRAKDLLLTMQSVCPDVFTAAHACWAATQPEGRMVELDAASFAAQPNISIDYAVMEKAHNVAVVPCDLGWSDIGSWNAFAELISADSNGNRSVGDAVMVDTRNTFVHSEQHLVTTVGVEDLVIVDTPDAVLIAHKDKTQDVKKIVALLKQSDHQAYRLHRTVQRPWGSSTVLEQGARFKIKMIRVKPGASLALQMHHHRNEHWIVVSGVARVINGEQKIFINTNESTYIPAGHRHLLENPGIIDLVMIEVQSGEYLGEDDIVRFENGQDHV